MVVASSVDVKPRAKMTKSTKNNKLDKSVLIIAQELKLARTLAGNNKTLRDRTLKKLKKWFDAREAQMPFTEDDFMRVWKGLFYYMWMSDKPLVQEECANNISKLADFKHVENCFLFFKCFLKLMINEWFGIDHLRLDKFLMLVRRVLRQVFVVMAKTEWNSQHISLFQDVLNETILKIAPNTPLSLMMHITEIYVEELAKVSQGEIAEDMVFELTRPFAFLLAFTRDGRQIQHINQYVFKYLMQQSDPGIEYQLRFDAWRQLGFPGGSINSMVKVEIDQEDRDDDLPEIEDSKPLDPRAGKVHVDLPLLKFDPVKFADMLGELKYNPDTNPKSRRALAELSKRTLATGKYPYGLTRIKARPKNKCVSTKVKNSLKRLERFEKSVAGDSKKVKTAKERNKKIKEIVQQELEKYKNIEKSETLEDFISKSEGDILVPATTKTDKKILATPSKLTVKKAKKRKSTSDDATNPKKRFERNSGVWEVDDLDTSEIASPATENWITENSENETPSKPADKESKTRRTRSKSSKAAANKETEITINSLGVFSTPRTSLRGKNLSTQKSLLKNPFSTPTSSAKKVKIALNLNRSQDHSEYHQSLVSSPGIPYDADKKPSKPLLKMKGSLPGAINPFYKFKK